MSQHRAGYARHEIHEITFPPPLITLRSNQIQSVVSVATYGSLMRAAPRPIFAVRVVGFVSRGALRGEHDESAMLVRHGRRPDRRCADAAHRESARRNHQ